MFAGFSAPVATAQHSDIVDIAAGDDQFSTLVAAVKAADLVETLKGDGPFTVFAPTNDAFAALPEGTVETLLKPENKDQLVAILTYHVVPGEVKSTDILNVAQAQTVNGQSVGVGLTVGGANVIAADIEASNGVIHVIDAVLLPPTDMSQNTMSERPAELIRNAIALGAPLYNDGNAEACTEIYRTTARALLNSNELPREARMALNTALDRAGDSHDSDRQAWIMREGLDMAYAAVR